MSDKNLINIFKTKKYLKEQKNKIYYDKYGITTFLGKSGGRKNNISC